MAPLNHLFLAWLNSNHKSWLAILYLIEMESVKFNNLRIATATAYHTVVKDFLGLARYIRTLERSNEPRGTGRWVATQWKSLRRFFFSRPAVSDSGLRGFNVVCGSFKSLGSQTCSADIHHGSVVSMVVSNIS